MRHIPKGFISVKTENEKDPSDWIKTAVAQQLMEKLKQEINTDILYVVHNGGRDSSRGTWLHPSLHPFFVEWQRSSGQKQSYRYRFEDWHREELAKELQGKTNVETPAGVCDIETEDYAIEVKDYKHWAAAIGQAQSYAFFLKKKPAIYLFNGQPSPACIKICNHLNVHIFLKGAQNATGCFIS